MAMLTLDNALHVLRTVLIAQVEIDAINAMLQLNLIQFRLDVIAFLNTLLISLVKVLRFKLIWTILIGIHQLQPYSQIQKLISTVQRYLTLT